MIDSVVHMPAGEWPSQELVLILLPSQLEWNFGGNVKIFIKCITWHVDQRTRYKKLEGMRSNLISFKNKKECSMLKTILPGTVNHDLFSNVAVISDFIHMRS